MKVNATNKVPITQKTATASHGLRQGRLSFFKRIVSKIKVIAADTKKITILIQSGDFPIAPL